MATTSQQQLEVLTGKILSHAQARGGFSTALMYQPDDRMEAAHGKLLFVIDISSPSPLSADIAYNLIDIIKEEYYSDLELSANESFENALKAANEELAAIAKQGEKDWVGKFNAIIAAVHGKSVYIVQRGTAEIHLLRGANMLNLSKGIYTPGETYKPEETLVNLIEGQVQVGDKIIASTSELFYYISIEKLKRLIDSLSPSQAAKKLADQLGSEDEINRTSVLISEFTLPELLGDEAPEKSTENWVGIKDESLRKPAVSPLPQIKEIVIDKDQSIEDISHSFRADQFKKPVTEVDEYDEVISEEGPKLNLSSFIPKFSTDGLKNLSNNIKLSDYTPKFNIESPRSKQILATTWRIVRGVGLLIGSVIMGGVAYAATFVRAMKRRKNGNQILLAIVGGIAVLIVVSSIGISRGYTQRVGSNKAVAALSEAKQKRDAAQAAMIYENGAKARDLFAEAYALATTATGNPKTKDEASKLASELLTQLDTASGVKRFKDVQPLANFDGLSAQLGGTSDAPKTASVSDVAVLGGNIYAIDGANNKIYKFKTTSGEYSIANSLTSTDKSLKLVSASSDQDILIYANPNSMYSFNTEQNTLTGKGLDTGNWGNANQIIAYTNKIYMLDAGSNQILKYQTVPEGYTSVAPYFESGSGVDLKGAINFAIDGNVWVLLANNTLKKFTSGVDTPFSFRSIPNPYPAIGNLTHMYTDSNSQLYVLDAANNRVLSFSKDGGDSTGQWIYDNIKDPTGLSVDEAGGFIYITAGTSVYRLPLK